MNNRRWGEGSKRRETDRQTSSEKQGDSIRDRKNKKTLEEQEGGKEEYKFKPERPPDTITLKKREQEGRKKLGTVPGAGRG